MMHESLFPFTGKVTLEELTNAPPSSAFNLEPRNVESISLETDSDLSISLLQPPPQPASNWQKRLQTKMIFVAKAITFGIFMFAATALVANVALFVGSKVMGGSHKTSSFSFSLSLDEDTAKRITSIDHLAQILDYDVDDSGVLMFRWPQSSEDGNDCPHCGQIDDDDGNRNGYSIVSVSDKLDSDENYWTVQFSLSQKSGNDEGSPGARKQDKHLRSRIQDESKVGLSLEAHTLSTATVNGAFDDSEKVLVSELEEFLCAKIMEVIPEDLKDTVQRFCQLQKHSEGIIITAEDDTTTMLGSDRDEHGCIVSAGYTWCESLNTCHRPWETICDSSDGNSMLGNDRDEHGCDLAAGFSWCETSKSCHRAWESNCGDNGGTTLLGNDNDEHGCDRSAGYSWCEASNSCHRAWETTCGTSQNDVTV